MPNKEKLALRLARIFEIPGEIITDIPKITWYGSGDMIFENFRSVVEYSEYLIRVSTSDGVYSIRGKRLEIVEITQVDLLIKGYINSIEK